MTEKLRLAKLGGTGRQLMKRALRLVLAIVLGLGIAIYGAFQLSPWPSVLLLRMAFDKDANAASAALVKHVPPGIIALIGERYDADDPDSLLDVFLPPGTGAQSEPLPAVVWVQGGAFVYGRRDNVTNYAKIMAGNGYAVIAIDYAKAPGTTYPGPLRQLNRALAFVQENAGRLHVDAERLFLAGDSAGAQIVGQMANIVTMPDYAAQVGIKPAIGMGQLRGVILHCGPHATDSLNFDGPFRGFMSTVLWSYFGTRDFRSDPRLEEFSVIAHLTREFPPIFISAGNADPLAPLSYQLKDKAETLGGPVSALFFPKDYQPPLGHEYQFNLDSEAGRKALAESLAFLKEHR